jgi:hypothetical protein
MKYLRRFNESQSDDFADYLYSLFEVEPDEVLQGENWYFGRWYWNDELNLRVRPELANLDQLLKSNKRFSDFITIVSVSVDIDILIVSPQYYNQNSKWLVSNLNWERHPLAVELDKHKELQKFASGSKLISDKAAIVRDLPNNCTLIKGMRFGDGLEFWPQNHFDDPIYVETDVELQALIYKYICDEKTNEGLFRSIFKWKKLNLLGINVSIQSQVKINDESLKPIIQKIKKLSERWNLVQNRCEVYLKKQFRSEKSDLFVKFRITDTEGDNEFETLGQIPSDIKSEIISDFHKIFGQNDVEVDEFPERGYLLFNVKL